MNTFIIENKFTGYHYEIRTKADVPALSTVKKHFRASRASGCKSRTTICEKATGDLYMIVDRGYGEEILNAE